MVSSDSLALWRGSSSAWVELWSRMCDSERWCQCTQSCAATSALSQRRHSVLLVSSHSPALHDIMCKWSHAIVFTVFYLVFSAGAVVFMVLCGSLYVVPEHFHHWGDLVSPKDFSFLPIALAVADLIWLGEFASVSGVLAHCSYICSLPLGLMFARFIHSLAVLVLCLHLMIFHFTVRAHFI